MKFDFSKKVKIGNYELSYLTLIVCIILIFMVIRSFLSHSSTPSPTAETFEDSKNAYIDEVEPADPSLENGENARESFTAEEIHAINFNTEWCGYSRQFVPVWTEFSSQCASIGVTAHDAKCDSEDTEMKGLCEHYKDKIPGFPTVLFVKGNVLSGEVIEYNGPRSVDGLMAFCQQLSL